MRTPFAETQTAVYDPYAQSWRFLGIVAVCNTDKNDGAFACPRQLLWAAYVDPHYSGAGVREYQYHHNSEWIKTACAKRRCAKLDCHERSTRMELLGIFKEPYFATEFFEQLFKHAGYCLWDTNVYGFMQNNYANWPEACTATEETDEDGNVLYLDLKPGEVLEYGLYTDAYCRVEYSPIGVVYDDPEEENAAVIRHKQSIQRIASNLGYVANTDTFNQALSVFKSCQLCRSYDLQSEDFHCYDAADYTNVNQCMKFRTHTSMQAVDWKDLEAAHIQGVLDSVTAQGQLVVSSNLDATEQVYQMGMAMGALSGLCLIAVTVFRWRKERQRHRKNELAVPLVESQASF